MLKCLAMQTETAGNRKYNYITLHKAFQLLVYGKCSTCMQVLASVHVICDVWCGPRSVWIYLRVLTCESFQTS